MALLNRPPQYSHLYDADGRLQGGLTGLEELSQVIVMNTGDDRDHDAMDETNDEIEPARELPISNVSHTDSLSMDSDEDMSEDDDEPGSSDDDAMEEIVMYDEPHSQLEHSPSSSTEPPLPQPPITVPSSPNAASLPSPSEIAAQGAALSRANSIGHSPDSERHSGTPRHGSRRSSRRATQSDIPPDIPLPIGEKLKRCFLDINILSTLLVG